jgi:hypothetical protein
MPTYTNQPSETNAIDTYIVSSTLANTNFGTQSTLQAGETSGYVTRSLLKDAFTGIPANATVVSASLSLTVNHDYCSNARTIRVFRQKMAWTEDGATWNKYDGSNSWQTAGGFGANDCEQTDIGNLSLTASETGTKVISLTPSKIQEMITGVFTNNGFLIKVDTESSDCYYYESSSSSTENIRPIMTVTYRVPSAAICMY